MEKRCESIRLSGVDAFDVDVSYVECTNEEIIPDEAHVHDKCEIYINLSGDLAFEVEGLVYPIFPGSVVITRPGELHRCVYRSTAVHKHYCIWFSANGNERFYEPFFQREKGRNNMFVLPSESFAAVISGVDELTCAKSEFSRLVLFFEILDTLMSGEESFQPYDTGLPSDVALAVTYINENMDRKISVNELAGVVGVNITTLERHFYAVFRISPREYMKKRRLNEAARLLMCGHNVTEACYACGFSDLSKFISAFKRQFGQTPKHYQKFKKAPEKQ